jgi:hypothetical protein
MTAHEARIIKIARPSGAGNTVCTVSNPSTVLWHTPLAKLGEASSYLRHFTLRVLPYSTRVSKHTVVVKCSSLRRCPVRKRIAQLREATNPRFSATTPTKFLRTTNCTKLEHSGPIVRLDG